ncbi:MAG: alpha-galactosidase [Blautia sp.]|nr:alpha-galactosidase [Blautia sp.]
MKVFLHDDGTWDLQGERHCLTGCYPMAMGKPLLSSLVSRKENVLSYEGPWGRFTCDFQQMDDGVLCLKSHLVSTVSLHDISPMGMAKVSGMDGDLRAFIQGLGMEGPSGVFSLGEVRLSSHGLIALLGEEGQLFCFAKEHRCFDNRYGLARQQGLFGDESVFLEAGFNLEGTREGDIELPDLYFFEGKDLSEVLTRIAKEIAGEMGTRHTMPPAYHWCSWYYQYQNMSQATLDGYLSSFKEYEPDFRYIQIDEGYCPSLGDWLLPNHLYPQGLSGAARSIQEAGFVPGIWIGPFMVGSNSKLYRDHPDWIIRYKDGRPLIKIQSYNEPKAFGLSDGEYYVLDASHPGALGYLKEVFETLYGQGYRLFKCDFMLWNSVDTSLVARYDASLTSFEILRRVLSVIREAIGEESYLLGCIAPFLPFLGFADGMRIAGDVGASWDGVYGPKNLLRELVADQYFNLIYWQNDPDAILLRDYEIFLSDTESESIALLQALSGGVVTTSEDLGRLSMERRKLLSFLKPSGFHKARFPYLGEEREELVLVQDLPQGKLLYVLNATERPLTVLLDLVEVTGKKSWQALRWKEEEGKEIEGQLVCRLWAHESALWFLSGEPLKGTPQNLWVWE